MANNEEEFKPYIKHNEKTPEFTWKAIIIGTTLGILFACANAYVGLISGLTISASIPVSVMSVAIFAVLHKFFKARRGTPLETNLSQTIGSAGESLAAGVIFTIPAMFMLGWDANYGTQVITISIIAAIGGILGVTFMIPLRQYLIKKEHKNLPFPEGTACAEVLRAGEEGGVRARMVFEGLGVGAFYKVLGDNVGYIYVHHLSDYGENSICRAMEAMPSAKAYIIDLSEASGEVFTTMACLSPHPGKVAAIISAGTSGFGELFARELVKELGTQLYGSQTAGCGGVAATYKLPRNLGKIRYSKASHKGLGGLLEFNGLKPHTMRIYDEEDLKNGILTTVNKAFEHLKVRVK